MKKKPPSGLQFCICELQHSEVKGSMLLAVHVQTDGASRSKHSKNTWQGFKKGF